MYQIFIPGPLPGLNDVITWAGQRVKWLEKGKKRVYKITLEKEKWDNLVAGCFLEEYHRLGGRGKPQPLTVPVDIECLWIERHNRRDVDNIHAGIKFILDGLVKAGALKNDTRRWIRRIEHEIGENDPDKPGVYVTIR